MSLTDSEVLFAFTKEFPAEYHGNPILISGEDSIKQDHHEYLLLKHRDVIQKVFKIKYLSTVGSSKEARVLNNLLAVGHYQFIYLFNLALNSVILNLELRGYFGHMYSNDNKLFMTDASGVYCFDDKGKLTWENRNLGIDSVYISDFDNEKIYGSGEWNHPEGWRDFILDKRNGYIIR